MADIKINDLTAYTDPVSTDVLPIVDVGSDITKKVSIADLLENAGTGSAAAPSFSFDGDNNTGIYRPAADQVALTAGGTQALLAESTGITIPGNLTVSGTTTTVDTVNLTVKDKNIELGVVSTPSNTTADGGGITLKGATDKTITWVNSTGAWTFNQPVSVTGDLTIPDKIIHSGDTNTFIRFPAADTFSVDTAGAERLRVDGAGNLGINNSSPSSYASDARNLVVGSGSGSNGITIASGASNSGTIYFADGTSGASLYTGTITYNHSSNYMAFWANENERLRIDSSGNVGIGTSSPAHNLDISPASGAAEVKIAGAEGQEASIRLYADQGDDAADIKKLLTDTSGNFKIQHYSGSAFVDSMVINSSGNATFTGDITKSTSSGSSVCIIRDDYLRIYDNPVSYDDYKITLEKTGSATFAGTVNTSSALVGPGALGVDRGVDDDSAALFVENSTGVVTRLNCDGSATFAGNVGIGTSSPSMRLDVKGTVSAGSGSDEDLQQWNIGSNNVKAEIKYVDASASRGMLFGTSTDHILAFQTNNAERMRIASNGLMWTLAASHGHFILSAQGAGATYAFLNGRHSSTGFNTGTSSFWVYTNGNVTNTNNSYGAISDIKLKENIVDAGSQWDDFKAVRFRKYNFKEETGHETFTQLGVIAQELELVSPGLVTDSPDLDEDGNDLGTVTKSVNYSVLYMKAVKALQEAMDRIETLEQRLSDAGIA